jgi:hypothetical protein
MSSFLWVEDFEGAQYREFAYTLFGQALGLHANDFPEEENALRIFLEERQITLATSYAEAARLLEERLDDFDNVVLDIDLELVGEDGSEDMPWVLPVLERWYGYKPGLERIEEEAYNDARKEMKAVAGYHLFLDLVLGRGFAHDAILFCSNHGEHLVSIKKSFEPAKIEAPDILIKKDPKVGRWVASRRDDPYTKLRRWILLACKELLEGKSTYRIVELQKDDPDIPERLTQIDGENLLQTLPLLLPATILTNEKNTKRKAITFRLFVRTLTQDWDNKVDYKKLKGFDKPCGTVLSLVRNWTSHDGIAFSQLSERDMAFLFLTALRLCFDLGHNLKKFESALLPMLGKESLINTAQMEQMKKDYENTYAAIEARWRELPKKSTKNKYSTELTTRFNDRVNDLQNAKKLFPGEHEKIIRQVFWHQLHQLHWADGNGFNPQLSYFERPNFLGELVKHLYCENFE